MGWRINGGHKQETREGYNLLDTNSATVNYIESGKSFSVKNDGAWTVNEAVSYLKIDVPSIVLKAGNTYTIVRNYAEETNSWLSDNAGNNVIGMGYNEDHKTITLSEDKTIEYYEGSLDTRNFYIWLYEGNYDSSKVYEQYGASPSPSFPSEIETINGSVEINVVNKNYLTKAQQQTKTFNNVNFEINENGEINIQGLANASGEVAFELESPCKMSNLINKTVELIVEGTPTATIGMRFLDENTRLFELIPNSKTVTLNLDDNYINKNITAIQFYINNSGDYNLIIKPGIYAEFQTEFTPHQSQIAIIPIQQELLENDYIADVEHHECGKLVLDGENYGCFYMFPNGRFSIADPTTGELAGKDCKKIENWAVAEPQNICCTHLSVVSVADQSQRNMLGITNGVTEEIIIKLDNATEETNTWTSETINAYLKQQYETGTPITIYYKLETPFDLELTEEQKAVRDTKLYTYKNITNIRVSDELASIDVTYKKDLETEHNKLQNEIDEIKQLISTTETSALLLDNLQKDVESEVE